MLCGNSCATLYVVLWVVLCVTRLFNARMCVCLRLIVLLYGLFVVCVCLYVCVSV